MKTKRFNNFKTKLGILTALATILGGAYFAEDRWNQRACVKAAEVQIKQVEQQTVKTLKQFEKQQSIRNEINRLQWIDDLIIKNKMDQRKFPNDGELREEGSELKDRRKKIKESIEELTKTAD